MTEQIILNADARERTGSNKARVIRKVDGMVPAIVYGDEKETLNIKLKLNELTKKFPDLEANILGVIRNNKFVILKKNDVMQINDKAYVIINSSQMAKTLIAFGHNEKISNKILIIGGGNIGFNLAKNATMIAVNP